jgi:hypothetical protein
LTHPRHRSRSWQDNVQPVVIAGHAETTEEIGDVERHPVARIEHERRIPLFRLRAARGLTQL